MNGVKHAMTYWATVAGGLGGTACAYVSETLANCSWWQYLLIAVVPTLLGIAVDIVLAILKKKGYVSNEDASKISAEKVTKLSDDMDELLTYIKTDGTDEDDSKTEG